MPRAKIENAKHFKWRKIQSSPDCFEKFPNEAIFRLAKVLQPPPAAWEQGMPLGTLRLIFMAGLT